MNRLGRMAAALAAGVMMAVTPLAAQAAIDVVAGENVYGGIAETIGGSHVTVTSILSNPMQDPHSFEASPSTARALAGASLVIVNGIDYDPWMNDLLSANAADHRRVVVVADLLKRKSGDNPHLWYDSAAAPAVASAIAQALEETDAANAADYAANLKSFLATLAPVQARIAALKAKYAGTPVTASEPVVGLLASALGFNMRNEAFQTAVMNDTEPSASSVAAFESDLKNHKVAILFYNDQVTDEVTDRLLALAKKSGVAIVGVQETQPAGKTFPQWMMATLDAIEGALARKP
ncbi:MAG: zinc ABC transporter substrate-binding protein [Parvibaculaceae bacterium]|nr:zinc ABC transporter substrate-binding protein [Parvibaculaceae bacterium]